MQVNCYSLNLIGTEGQVIIMLVIVKYTSRRDTLETIKREVIGQVPGSFDEQIDGLARFYANRLRGLAKGEDVSEHLQTGPDTGRISK